MRLRAACFVCGKPVQFGGDACADCMDRYTEDEIYWRWREYERECEERMEAEEAKANLRELEREPVSFDSREGEPWTEEGKERPS